MTAPDSKLVKRVARVIAADDGGEEYAALKWSKYTTAARAALAACQAEELREVLKRLVDIKSHKDTSGKTIWYEEHMPLAWAAARALLAKLGD